MTVTRQHMEAIAEIIRRLNPDVSSYKARESVALAFAEWLQVQNPRFQRDRFLRACHIVIPEE